MLNPTSDAANAEGLFRRILAGLLPSFRPRGEVAAARLSLVHSLALGKDCHLLLVACGDQRYLIGRGKASVDSIVPIEAPPPAIASSQPWQSLASPEYAKA